MDVPTEILPAELRAALGHFATGVSVITTRTGAGEPVGTTVSALTSVSLDPPLVLVCLDRGSATLGALRRSATFAINVLAVDQEALSTRFARKGRHAGWDGVAHRIGRVGAPQLDGALAVVDCEVQEHLEGGDHEIVLARPVDLAVAEHRSPLLHFRGAYGALA